MLADAHISSLGYLWFFGNENQGKLRVRFKLQVGNP